jgi:hypothetical protein
MIEKTRRHVAHRGVCRRHHLDRKSIWSRCTATLGGLGAQPMLEVGAAAFGAHGADALLAGRSGLTVSTTVPCRWVHLHVCRTLVGRRSPCIDVAVMLGLSFWHLGTGTWSGV